MLPPAVLGVGAGVDDVASCERRCGRYIAAFSSYGKPVDVIRSRGRGVGDRPQSSGVPVGVMEVYERGESVRWLLVWLWWWWE